MRGSIVQLHPLSEPGQLLPFGDAYHPDPVLTRDFRGRVGESVERVPLVREEEKPLGLEIQAPHIPERTVGTLEEGIDGGPLLRISKSRDHTARLVEENPARRIPGDERAVHLDPVVLRVHPGAEFGHTHPVHPHSPLQDQPFRRPP